MVKYVALAVAMAATVLVVDQAQARHRRGGCPGGVCATGGGPWTGYYGGGCPGGVCGVPVGPAYYPAPPMKAAVVPSGPAVVAEAPQPAIAPVVAQPQVQYYYTNTGRLGWRRLGR